MSKSDFGFYSPNNAPEGCVWMEVLGWFKNKNPQNPMDFEGSAIFDCANVEPQRIELWSREDNAVPSTCLVDIYCREKQGYQHPKPFLSYCVLSALSNITRSSSALRHR